MKKIATVIITCILLQFQAEAQFYTEGSDPAGIRWSQISTAGYTVIYPEGKDSLARVYARNLEKVRQAVGSGIGVIPNGNYKRPMPVVLHTRAAISNGMVTWVPRHMELYTTPDPYFPETNTWDMQLAIHESRHVSQMQIGASKTFKWLRYPLGELVDGALCAVYGGPVFFEGDAVVAETALTNAGRGRSADFLEYQRACFDAGEFRNYWQWLYGSLYRYTPDHYKIGYMLNAGARSLYDAPDFTQRFYDRIYAHHGVTFRNTQKTVQELSGKPFKESFADISRHFQENWQALADSRAPFMKSDTLVFHDRRYVSYTRLGTDGTSLFAVRSGLAESTRLVCIGTDGSEKFCKNFALSGSSLKGSGMQFWSEYRSDLRWEHASSSDVHYRSADGKVHRLTSKGKFFNPAPSPDGNLVAVAEYLEEGGSVLVLLDLQGKRVSETQAPAGMQILEPAWLGGKLYVSALTSGGVGIFDADGFLPVLAPQYAKLSQLDSHDGKLVFESDRSGVMELYSLDPHSGRVLQLTNTRNGAHNFVFLRDSLYYTMQTPRSVNIYRSAVSELPVKEVDFFQRYEDPIAAKLSAGEKISIADADVEISEPRCYSKLGHLFHFHSWAPVYVNYDDVSSLTSENIFQNVGLGATAFFQNALGTSYGSVGYHLDHRGWRSSGHAKYVWRGWYPVIEASVDFNDRNAYAYRRKATQGGMSMQAQQARLPYLGAYIKTYIPFNLSSGGWSRGVIPQLSISAGNDVYGFYNTDKKFIGQNYMSRLSMSLRAYTMLRTPGSCVYPKWGIGAELGWSMRPSMTDVFTSNAHAFVYAYVPGILPEHGIRLSGVFAGSPSGAIFAQETVNTAPRGFSGAAAILGAYPSRNKFTFDYAMPFASIEWSGLSPVAYVRNLELDLHGDYSFFSTAASAGNLFSVGADFCVKLGNILWLPFDTKLGVSYNYNGGSAFEKVVERTGDGHSSVSLVFSIAM